MSIRELLTVCRASIIMSKQLRGLRKDDTFIMDHVQNSNFSGREINMITK